MINIIVASLVFLIISLSAEMIFLPDGKPIDVCIATERRINHYSN
jgi:hypothetical protein